MTKDIKDIMKLAREAGFDPHDMSDDFTCNLKDIERLYRAAYAAGAAAERKACAALCSEVAAGRDAEAIEEAILKRGEK
jgi:hypothetical protein